MKLRLAQKLGIILVITVILSAAISAAIVSISTRSAFMKLVRENDIQAARNIARGLEEFYAQQQSWTDVDAALENPFWMMPEQPRRNPMGRMGPMGNMGPQNPLQGGGERRPLFRLLLADSTGAVIAHTFEEAPPSSVGRSVLENGVSLEYAGQRIGYLFVGSMIEGAFGPFQRAFLVSVYRSLVAASLIVGALFPLLGMTVMRRHITGPLRRISSAAEKIAGGEYDISYDISTTDTRSDEIGELGRSFQQMAVELAAADEWKRKLISDSAHELRTPVSVLQGNLEMILDGVYLLDRSRIERLYGETQLLDRLVRELQDLAQAESKAAQYQFSDIDLRQLIETTASNFESAAAAKSIVLETELPQSPVRIRADRDKMKQIWVNIIQNALRYAPKRSRIRLDLQDGNDGTLRCSCEDDGPGLSMAEREKVFERFYRVQHDRNRSTGGSGLGLAIVREIVNRHNGKVYFENPKALKGARLVIELPKVE
jgi:signal transduction histidine kinase